MDVTTEYIHLLLAREAARNLRRTRRRESSVRIFFQDDPSHPSACRGSIHYVDVIAVELKNASIICVKLSTRSPAPCQALGNWVAVKRSHQRRRGRGSWRPTQPRMNFRVLTAASDSRRAGERLAAAAPSGVFPVAFR
jgi:hypothetical protein